MSRIWIGLPLLLTLPLVARPVAAQSQDGLQALIQVLAEVEDPYLQRDFLQGISSGLEGRRRVEAPTNWPAAYQRLQRSPDRAVRELAQRLALKFRDPVARQVLRRRAQDTSQPSDDRSLAIGLLVEQREVDFDGVLIGLLADPDVRRAALRGLAEYRHPETPAAIVVHYAEFDPAARQDALLTLATRPEWALSLLDAVKNRTIERSDLSAYTVRQLQSLGDDRVTDRVVELWGVLRTTSAARRRRIAELKRAIVRDLPDANLEGGKQVFTATCAACHRLFNEGTIVGPDLTGAQRKHLDYLLENVVDPNASVSRDFQMEVIRLVDGRVITGLVIESSAVALTVKTLNDKQILPLSEIDERKTSELSLMPEGQLDPLTREQIRDLFGYLMQ